MSIEVQSRQLPRTLKRIEAEYRLAITKQRIVASLVTFAGLLGLGVGALIPSMLLGWTGTAVFLAGLGLFYVSRRREDFHHVRRFPPEIRAAIRAGRVHAGMTKEMVLLAIGHPFNVTRTIDGDGVHEEWTYRGEGDAADRYFRFDNGTLETYSN